MKHDLVLVDREASIVTITLNRPERRNAVDLPTAAALERAFCDFEGDPALRVAVLTGAGGHFCAGADLQAFGTEHQNRLEAEGAAPMGISRMNFSKPVIAAVSGYAVAGGLELALCCDLRVAERSALFGVFCRRFGVPLIDGGTARLPRLIGRSRALDMILTGRAVSAEEALGFGLVNRVVEDGHALECAKSLARDIAAFPNACLLADRESLYQGENLPLADAMRHEFSRGMRSMRSGEAESGAEAFRRGKGRHGRGLEGR